MSSFMVWALSHESTVRVGVSHGSAELAEPAPSTPNTPILQMIISEDELINSSSTYSTVKPIPPLHSEYSNQ